MPTPYGHALIGYTLARQLGFERGRALLAGALATLPDIDIPIGLALRADLFAFHRGPTHRPAFAALTGAAAFLCHRRCRPRDGMRSAAATGALIALSVGSHVVVDAVEWPYLNRVERLTHSRVFRDLPTTLRWELLNVGLDLLMFGLPSLLLAARRGPRVAKNRSSATLGVAPSRTDEPD